MIRIHTNGIIRFAGILESIELNYKVLSNEARLKKKVQFKIKLYLKFGIGICT